MKTFLPNKTTLVRALIAHGNWREDRIERREVEYTYEGTEVNGLVAVILDFASGERGQRRALLATDVGKEISTLDFVSTRALHVYRTTLGNLRTWVRWEVGVVSNEHFIAGGHTEESAEAVMDLAMDSLSREYAQACEDRARWAEEDAHVANATAHGDTKLAPHSATLVLSSKKGAHTGTVGRALWAAASGTGTVLLARTLEQGNGGASDYVEGTRCVSAPVMPFDGGVDSARVFCEALFPKDSLKNQLRHGTTGREKMLVGFSRLFELLACDEGATQAVRLLEGEYRSARDFTNKEVAALDKKSAAKLRSALRRTLATLVVQMRNVLRPLLAEAGLAHLLKDAQEAVDVSFDGEEETNVTYA